MPLAAGTRLGPYEIVAPLGAGGMGEVYLARDGRLEREVALKLLSVEEHADASARRRLLHEARLGARLEHPGICPVYEVGEDGGRVFLAMQRIPGRTLAAEIDAGPIPESRAVDLAIQVAAAVAHAHEHGIIHRDLKPLNVMITPEGRAVVLDFGLARAAPVGDADSAQTVTAAGVITGTPTAMSPEQVRGEPLDGRSDVFSFGALLYAMVTGHEAFARTTSADTIAAILTAEPPSLATAAPATSPEFRRIVEKCLAKGRDLRYGSVREVLVDLERLRRGASSAAVHRDLPAASAPSRRWTRGFAVGGVALVAIAAAAVLLMRGGSHMPVNVRTLAVLPFRSLSSGTDQNFLGLGVADAVISRASQDSGLIVRPTSAVRRYVTADVDAGKAGAELKVDAVLEGTWQQEGDRLRVTANLLRTSDGVSLWSDRFDAQSAGIFEIEDQISERLVSRLRGRLAGAASRAHGETRNPEAYAAYTKGLFYFSERGYDKEHRENSDNAIRLFGQAVQLDPDYALAHAQLGYAYAWTVAFIDEDSTLVSRAERELSVAERLDPELGLVHLVRSVLDFTFAKGWQLGEAIREFREAERLGENTDAEIELHLGLESGWRSRKERLIAEDPSNLRLRNEYVNEAYLLDLAETGRKLQKELLNEEPDTRYWFLVRDLDRAGPPIDQAAREHPEDPIAQIDLAVLEATRRHCDRADALIRRFEPRIPRNRSYHHMTFECAQAYGICGEAPRAVHWLEVTATLGFPCYPLFERDWCLDPIRKSPEFLAFMEKLRPEWERYRAEVGE